MQSYGAILDSADNITNDSSSHGRPVSSSSSLTAGQNTDGGISHEAMHAMHLNATYGMQMLDAALKLVRGDSPPRSGSVSGPSPGNATSAMGIVHSIPSPPSKSTMTSSLAGAVTPSQEATVPSATSSSSVHNTSPKAGKEVIGIRVIEDGPMKKPENKENGPKSGDRKRQVGSLFCRLRYE